MLARQFEKTWVQYLVLGLILGFAAWFWGFVFRFHYKFDWSVLFVENQTYGLHLGLELLKGLALTVKISIVSAAVALALGTAAGLARLSHFRPLRLAASFYVEFFRNTPLLVQLFFWYFALPKLVSDPVREWLFSLHYEFWVAVMGLAVYTGAFMAEVIRAGLQSIQKGLLEAAYSSGLTYFQVLTRIILPLAFRAIIPPLGSEFLNNMKNSSLAMVVGVADLTWQSQQIESLTFRGFEATTAATVLYLSLSLSISGLLNLVNRRLRMESAQRRTALDRFLDRALDPLWLALRVATRPLRRALRRRRSLTRSALGALWVRCLGLLRLALAFAAKAAFLGLLAFLAWRIVLGLRSFDWNVVWDNLPTLLIWRFPHGDGHEILWGLGGLSFSLIMACIAISVSFVLGLFIGLARMAENRILRLPATAYIELIRGNPLIIVIFWVYFFIPVLLDAFLDVFWSATIALTLFTAAYIAEIVRGGIQNIPRGQFEAAYSTGLSYAQTMRRIILPQALKQMIPAIVGQFIAIFKDTSLAYVIGVLELTFVAQGLNNRLMVHPFEIYSSVAALYFLGCYAMSLVAARLERRLTPEKIRLRM
jgi:polar amino acid transport system permease protein